MILLNIFRKTEKIPQTNREISSYFMHNAESTAPGNAHPYYFFIKLLLLSANSSALISPAKNCFIAFPHSSTVF